MEMMSVLWPEVIRPLLILVLVVAAISVVTWHFSRPKPSAARQNEAHARRCPSCAAGVYHSQHDGRE